MGKTYGFKEQLLKGKEGEARLDTYFSKWYFVSPVTMDLERKGIDRKFKRGSIVTYAEYKTDSLTQKTGNIFVETISVDTLGRLGWAWTCTADLLMYLALPNTLYVVNPTKVRECIEVWQKAYGVRSVKNKGYKSVGIPVPVREFSKICESVRDLYGVEEA